MVSFHHTTTLEVPTPDGAEFIDVDVRLTLEGSLVPATKPYYSKSFGNWLPGNEAEFDYCLREVEIGESVKGEAGSIKTTWRLPITGSNTIDDMTLACAVDYVDSEPEGLIEDLIDAHETRNED